MAPNPAPGVGSSPTEMPTPDTSGPSAPSTPSVGTSPSQDDADTATPPAPPGPEPADGGAGGTGGGDAPVDRPSFANLRQAAAAAERLVGAAVDVSALEGSSYAEVLAREFDYVTPENASKWGPLAPSSSSYDWSGTDAIVDFAATHQQQVKGHTLIWHLQYPDWLSSSMSAGELRDAIQRHIETTLERYRGRMRAWDVVNEAVDVSTDSGYTQSIFYEKLGPEYIADAFRWARAADPELLLFYNEIGIERLGEKSDFTYQMIKDLVEQGVPIDGIGLQSHISTHRYPSETDLRANIRRFADLGLIVNLSEVDARTRGFSGDQQTRWLAQRIAFAQVVGSCVVEPGCEAVTFWGFTDNTSWLNDEGPQDPLLFDSNYMPKPAYDGAMDGFAGVLPVRGANLLSNGDFADGSQHWSASSGELSVGATLGVDENAACLGGRVTEADGLVQRELSSALASGGPMAFSARVRVDAPSTVDAALLVEQAGTAAQELNIASRLIEAGAWLELSGYLGLGFEDTPTSIELKLHGPPSGVELCVTDVKLQPLSMP